MNLRRVFKSIRARITFWHLGVLTLTILVFMIFSQVFLWKQLRIELKAGLRDDVEMVERFLEAGSGGEIVWSGHEMLDQNDGQKRWIEVVRPDGRLIYRNFTEDNPFSAILPMVGGLHQERFYPLFMPDGVKLSGIKARHQVDGTNLEIRVARSQTRIFEEMRHLFLAQILCLPLVILAAWCGGYIFAGRVLKPLQKIIERMRTISADRLGERLAIENPDDELGRLSMTFNSMLAKIDCSFEQVRQFTADASHELRTPLAAIRSVGEIALRSKKDEVVCRETIASILEEVEKMTHLVEDLLAMARADGGSKTIPLPEELGELVREEISLFGVLAEEQGQLLQVDIAAPCLVLVDKKILRLAVGNILHNAIKFTPAEGEIRVSVQREADECLLAVADSGPGIGPEHQDRVFDRFYRIDKDRSRNTGGSGLGLAIAKWAVEVNGGRVELARDQGNGSIFRIRLPLHNPPGSSSPEGSRA